MPDEMISASWKSAKVFVPGLPESPVKFNEVPEGTKKHPVIIFLHGCGGINKPSVLWGKVLSKLGYIVVLPNSYAIPGRKVFCDIKNKKTVGGAMGVEIKTLRANEVRVAKNEIIKMSWADDESIFLMGHSEGASGVVFTRDLDFRAIVASGYKCGKKNRRGKLPIRVDTQTPILFIYYKNDPWFDYDNCKEFVKTRDNVHVIELEGNTHQTSTNQIAREAVAKFLSKNKK